MKVRNKYFVHSIEAEATALAAKIDAYLKNKPGREFVSIAKLRVDVPEVAAAGRDVLNHALSKIGAEIDESGADNA
ncbi:MAG: hypothetical protein AB1592_18910 [Pseudomonadota bacterium]